MVEKTIVLDIPIHENDEKNEYSYLDLIESYVQSKKEPQTFGEESESKLSEIATSLEKKYGNMVTINKKGKKRKVRVDDFIDHGEGYDSQDSFIDDSEAVELMVAPTISTKFGGFFINEGFLDGVEETVMNIEPPAGVPKRMEANKPNKRHVLKMDKSKQLLERAVKRLANPKVTTGKSQPSLSVNGMMSLDSVFDSVLAYQPESRESLKNEESTSEKTSKPQNPSLAPSPSKGTPVASMENSSSLAALHTNQKPKTMGPCVLPELPEKIKAIVQLLIVNKPLPSSNGKLIFSPDFDKDLLAFDCEMLDMRIKKSARSAVYAYLEEEFQVKRKSLITKLRKLREEKAESKLEPMLVALKEAVSKAMPDILATYSRDMANYQDRLNTWENEKQTNIELKRPGAPKKIFRWNSDCRSLMERIVTCRMETAFSTTGKCVEEEQLKRFYHTLLPLWPDNWISVAALWRAGLQVYQRLKMKQSPSDGWNTSNGSTAVKTLAAPATARVSSQEKQAKQPSSLSSPQPLSVSIAAVSSASVTAKPTSVSSPTVTYALLNQPRLAAKQQVGDLVSITPVLTNIVHAEKKMTQAPNIRSVIATPIVSLISQSHTVTQLSPCPTISTAATKFSRKEFDNQLSSKVSRASYSGCKMADPIMVDLTTFNEQRKTPPPQKQALPPISTFSPPSASSTTRVIHPNGTNVKKFLPASGGQRHPDITKTFSSSQQSNPVQMNNPPFSSTAGKQQKSLHPNATQRHNETSVRVASPPSSQHIRLTNNVTVPLDRLIVSNAALNSGTSISVEAVSNMLAAYNQRRLSESNSVAHQPSLQQQRYVSTSPTGGSSSLWMNHQVDTKRHEALVRQSQQQRHPQGTVGTHEAAAAVAAAAVAMQQRQVAQQVQAVTAHLQAQSLLAEQLKNMQQYRRSDEEKTNSTNRSSN